MRLLRILAIGSLLTLAGCGSQQEALKESLIKLDVAMKQGFSSDERGLAAFQALILDSRTKLEIAKDSFFFRRASEVEASLQQVEAVETIWKQQFRGECASDCVWTVEKELVVLGIVKGQDDFRTYLKSFGPSDDGVMATGLLLSAIASQGMMIASAKVEAAEADL